MQKKSFGLSILSSIILILSFPNYDFWYLAWVAFIPFFFAIQEKSGKEAFFAGLTFGFCFFLGLIHWVINTMMDYGGLPLPVGVLLLVLLSLYLGLFFGLFSWLITQIKDKKTRWILAPFIWVTLEFLRTNLFTGFPWGIFGYSQYLNLFFIQLADITGVYGISFILLLTNITLYLLLNFFLAKKKEDFLLRPFVKQLTAVTCIILIFVFTYGKVKMKQGRVGGSPLTVALIQGNINQAEKWNPEYRDKTLTIYDELTNKTLFSKPDIIVWPETATPFFFQQETIHSKRVIDMVRKLGTFVLFGSPAFSESQGIITSYNRSYLVDQTGLTNGYYDKIHLVPFGEYVPLGNILTFVGKMVEGIGDFSSGEVLKVFEIPKGTFSTLICYEIIFPDLVRKFVKNGAGFLINITNDAWFGKSAAPYQHFAMIVFRAVENRVPVIRSANTGVSGIVNSRGEIIEKSEIFVQTALTGSISLEKNGKTIYTEHGDLFAFFCLTVIFLFAGFLFIQKVRS